MIGCSHRAITLFFFPSWCFEVRLGKKKIGNDCETRHSLPNCDWLTVIEQDGLPPADHFKECRFTYIFFTYLKTVFGSLSESPVIHHYIFFMYGMKRWSLTQKTQVTM